MIQNRNIMKELNLNIMIIRHRIYSVFPMKHNHNLYTNISYSKYSKLIFKIDTKINIFINFCWESSCEREFWMISRRNYPLHLWQHSSLIIYRLPAPRLMLVLKTLWYISKNWWYYLEIFQLEMSMIGKMRVWIDYKVLVEIYWINPLVYIRWISVNSVLQL